MAESAAQRATANALFGSGEYDSAIKEYDAAVSTCPNYLDYDLAVLRSNISACHLKLNAWKDAIAAATAALDKLDMLDGTERRKEDEAASDTAAEADVEEIVSPEAARIASTAPLDSQGHTAAQVQKLRIKALLRRAKARSELQGWSALEGAMEDYKTLSALPGLSPQDAKVVQRALVTLPPRAKAAQETETAEMMGKLKEVGPVCCRRAVPGQADVGPQAREWLAQALWSVDRQLQPRQGRLGRVQRELWEMSRIGGISISTIRFQAQRCMPSCHSFVSKATMQRRRRCRRCLSSRQTRSS